MFSSNPLSPVRCFCCSMRTLFLSLPPSFLLHCAHPGRKPTLTRWPSPAPSLCLPFFPKALSHPQGLHTVSDFAAAGTRCRTHPSYAPLWHPRTSSGGSQCPGHSAGFSSFPVAHLRCLHGHCLSNALSQRQDIHLNQGCIRRRVGEQLLSCTWAQGRLPDPRL